MIKKIVSVLLITICFLLQSTLLSQFRLGGIVPNLMVIIIATVGFMRGSKTGMWVGFAFGILTDLFFGNLIGLYAFLYMFVGYLNGAGEKYLFSHDLKLPLLMIIISDFVYSNVCYFLFFLLKGRFDYLYYFTGVIMPELIYTAVFACFIYPFVHFVFGKLDKLEAKLSGENYIAEQ